MRFVVLSSLLLAACGGQVAASDAGTDASADALSADGGVCVDLDPSQFDTSCAASSDCIQVYVGTLCSGYNCACPSASISATSQAAYEALASKISMGPNVCSCPALGAPFCIASQCVFCPNPALGPSSYPPGCPDAGP